MDVKISCSIQELVNSSKVTKNLAQAAFDNANELVTFPGMTSADADAVADADADAVEAGADADADAEADAGEAGADAEAGAGEADADEAGATAKLPIQKRQKKTPHAGATVNETSSSAAANYARKMYGEMRKIGLTKVTSMHELSSGQTVGEFLLAQWLSKEVKPQK